MPKTRVAEIVSEVIENAIAPMLKDRGYRRNGTHYYKSEPGVLRVLNVQSSQWNTADEGRFMINLGIHLHALGDRPSIGHFNELDHPERRRVPARFLQRGRPESKDPLF